MSSDYFVHESSYVGSDVNIGNGTKIWHFSHIMTGARVGQNCNFGQNVHIGSDVVIGDNVKVQNNVSIYTGTVVEDDVFLGPSCVLTNVTNPRSQVVRRGLYEKTLIKRGATIGANATIVCGIEIGRYAFIAAGTVISKNVPDYALMVGVPGRRVCWMSRHGVKLPHPDVDGVMVCPESNYKYKEIERNIIKCLDIDEESPLPEDKAIGKIFYDDLKK